MLIEKIVHHLPHVNSFSFLRICTVIKTAGCSLTGLKVSLLVVEDLGEDFIINRGGVFEISAEEHGK